MQYINDSNYANTTDICDGYTYDMYDMFDDLDDMYDDEMY